MKVFDLIIKCILLLLLTTLVFVVGVQVFARFLLPRAPSWTEEITRFVMLFLVAFAAGITFRKNLFVNVDIVYQLLNKKSKIYLCLKIITNTIISLSMLVIMIYSLKMIRLGSEQTSPVLFIPMSIILVSMFLIPINILCNQVYVLYLYIKKGKHI